MIDPESGTECQRGAPESGAQVKKTRRSKDELRKLVLEAAFELLQADGAGTGVERLTFRRVFTHLEKTQGVKVTNSAVIGRIFESQEDFQIEVVHGLINEMDTADLEPTLSIVASIAPEIDRSSLEARRASLAEIIRISANAHIETMVAAPGATQTSLMAYLAAASPTRTDDRLVRAFRRVSRRLAQRYEIVYGSALSSVGWRIKEGYTIHDMAFTLAALSEGIIIRMLIEEPDHGSQALPSPTGQGSGAWNLLGIAANSLVDAFAEPDPDWRP